MPYIGQSPAAGETNSFKTLDDISSYTLTFDGSSASTVSVANDTITEREHRFVTGQRVTYNDGGGTAITGLSDGVYYIIVEDRHTFKLATNANNAASGTAINLTGLGVGASHTLNVAFDGVNTKFKATINNGTRADITSAPQLMLSINGVLQQPHNNTTTPATGYAVDHTSTIIFSAAPATGDQFFGNLVAESYSSFEISDNAVDNFTGDGSTTDFTLSKAPPNNESILVTIDGVVQYPDDTSAVRAYSVSENILSFVTAPGSAVEIQVRHIGFAGASSAGITGFYGRTGNAVLKSTDNIVFNNATASGTVQAANVTVTGDLTVNGTTTTLDTVLTEVDKLEVGANNTTVAVAVTQSGTGDILNLYDGSSEVFSVADGGAVSGVGSFTAASFHGDGSQLTGIDATQIQTGNTSVQTVDTGSDGHVKINTEGSERLRIESGGNIKYTVASGSNNGLALNDGSNDLFAFGTGGFSVNGGTATDGGIRAYNNLVFATGSSSSEKLRITSGGNVGIGSAIPTDILDIQTGSGDEVTKFKVKTAGRLELTRNHASAPYIKTLMGSGNPAIHLGDSSGDNTVIHGHGNSYFNGGSVGIGTANPARKVEIFDTAATVLQLNSTNSGGTSLRIQNSGTDKMYMGLAGDFIVGQGSNVTDSAIRASGALLFASGGGTERLRITSAGNIGIGTDDPDKQVHIEAAEPFVRLENTHAGSKRLDLRVEENDNHAYISAPQSGQNLNLYGRSAFTIATNSETTERFRITSDGKLGVNVTSPGCQTGGIHAVHDATEGTPSFTGGEVGIFQRNYNSAQGCEIGIIGGSNSSSRINFGDKDDADIGIISYSHNDNSMRFIVSAAERLRITSGGAVNIGGDYTQTLYKTQITGDLLIQKDQAAYQHPQIELYALNTGAYGGAIKFTGNASGTKYTQATIRTYGGGNTSDGSLAFFTGDGTEKVRITSGGALNIGTGVESGAVENLVELYVGGNDGSHATIRGKYNRTNEYNRSEVRFGVENNATGKGFLAFATGTNSASERMRITSAGTLLVAKTTTSLTTQGARVDNGLITVSGDSSSTNLATNSGGNLSLANVDSTDNNFSNIGGYNSNGLVVSQIDFINTSHSSRTGDIAFLTHNGSSMSERLRITSDGDTIITTYNALFSENASNNLALVVHGESSPTVYVSDSGNDSTGDGSSSSPFRTFTKAWNYIPKVFVHNQTARILIKGTSYTIDTTYYMRGGASGGNWQWGPAVNITSESGSQIDVYLRATLLFESVDGLRLNNMNFICDNANGKLDFKACNRGKIYNTCDMSVTATAGWSVRENYDCCHHFTSEMDITVGSSVTAGLGGLVVATNNTTLFGSRTITKSGTQFGNHGLTITNESFYSGGTDVNNFARGYAVGVNHYNAETGAYVMLNGASITNCNEGLKLYNRSFGRKYSVSYSGNNVNETLLQGSTLA